MIDERFIELVKRLRAQGRTQEEIAVELRVSQGTISQLLRKEGLGGKLVKVRKAG